VQLAEAASGLAPEVDVGAVTHAKELAAAQVKNWGPFLSRRLHS
jgi:hypothetical protein